MHGKMYHWQCDFCGGIAHTETFLVRKRCNGSIRGEKCNAFMKKINEEQLATHRKEVVKRLREHDKAVF